MVNKKVKGKFFFFLAFFPVKGYYKKQKQKKIFFVCMCMCMCTFMRMLV